MQCAQHRLAAGPDGLCALCHRQPGAQAARSGQRLVWGAGIALATLIVGLVLARPLLLPAGAPATSPVVVVTPEEPTSPEAAPESEPRPEEPSERAETPPARDPEASPELADTATPSDAPPAASVASTPSATPSASATQPTQAALASAVRATPIVMFSTSWCPVCQTARDFLAANGLRYSERDIDRDSNAREELKRRSGQASIPTLEVDGEMLNPGFSASQIMGAVAKSAQRRLGGAKIEIEPVR